MSEKAIQLNTKIPFLVAATTAICVMVSFVSIYAPRFLDGGPSVFFFFDK